MDAEPTEEQRNVEEVSKSVEIVVKTDAEAGASGYSVTGGGQQGIFVKDVLKDSPAAKHLSLKEGDQLLSAKVYFENVKYEDALKILQCAEPYKVSFELKRTIPGAEVSMRPCVPSVEVKGPKPKLTKMSVKGSKPFKAKKKRGGRFGLKRLKEKRREELVIEGTPPRLESGGVDVEFAFPTFKQRRRIKVEAEGAVPGGKAKRKIRFPPMKTKTNAGAKPSGEMEIGQVQGRVSPCEISGSSVNTREKGQKFGIRFPKTKHSKSSPSLDAEAEKVKTPSVTITPPSVELNLSGNKYTDNRDIKMTTPDVEFAFPSGQSGMKKTTDNKVGKPDAEGTAGQDASVAEVEGGMSKGDAKLRMPKLKLPKVRLSRHSDEIDGAIKVQAKAMPQNDVLPPKKGIETDENLAKMKAEGDLPGKALSSQIHVGDISLPKVKAKTDINVSLSGDQKKGEIMAQLPTVNMPVTDVDLNTRHSDEVESPNISMPKVDFSLHESESISLDRKNKNKFSQPTVDVSLPKAKGIGDVDMTSYVGGDGRFTMPDFDISIPNMTSTVPKLTTKDIDVEGDISLPKVKSPDVDVSIEGPEMKGGKLSLPSVDTDLDVEGPQLKGHKFKMPKFDVSLPKVNLPEGNVSMPALDISLPKGNLKGDVDVDGHMGKGARMHVPSVDLAMPKMKAKGIDLDIEGPELKGDISLPRGEFEADLNVEGPDLKGSKFKMPRFDVSLPKVSLPEGHINVQGPEIKGKKIEMPDIDISVPKGKCEGEIKVPGGKGGKFKMPKFDVSLPKVQLPESNIKLTGPEFKGKKTEMPDIDVSLPKGEAVGGIEIEGHGSKGNKFHMPSLDISLPKIKAKGPEIEAPEIKGGTLNMPSLDVSLPQVKASDVEINLEGPDITGAKVNIPAVDISLPKGKMEGEINVEPPDVKGGKFKMPKFDVSLPKISLPKVDANVEGPSVKGDIKMPSVDVSLPKGKTDVEFEIDGKSGKEGKFHLPSFDVSLPKIKSKGFGVDIPNIEGDVSLPKVKSPDVDVSIEGPECKGEKSSLPLTDSYLLKKNIGTELDIEGPEIKDNTFKMPKFDVTLPKVNLPEAKVDFDFGLTKPKDDNVEVELLKAEGGRPISGGSFNFPDVSLKVPSLSLPRFGAKSKSGDFNMSEKGPKAQNRAPSVEFDKNGKVKIKKPKAKMSVLGMKMKNEDVTASCPDVDIKVKRGKTDSSKPDLNVEGSKYKSKHRIKFPTFKFSSSKSQQQEEKNNANLHANAEREGGLSSAEVSINPGTISDLDKPSVLLETKAKSKVKIPSLELSLKGSNTPDTEDLLCTGEVDDPDVEIKGYTEGKLKMPQLKIPDVQISLPRGKTENPEVEFKGKGGKYKMMKTPDLDNSLPEQKIPLVDISLPKEKTKRVNETKDAEQFKVPNVELYIPKGKKDRGVRSDVDVGNIKLPQIKMPEVDVSLSKAKGNQGDVPANEMEATEEKVKCPDVEREDNDKGFQFSSPDLEVTADTAASGSFHLEGENKVMDFDIHSQGDEWKKEGRNVEAPDVNVTTAGSSKKIKGSKFESDVACKVPSIPDIEFDIASQDEDDEKLKTEKKIKIPKFGIPLPYISSPEARMHGYGQDFQHGGSQIPKVKKAVFVLVNPPQTDVPSTSTSLLAQTTKTTVRDIKISSAQNTEVKFENESKDKGITISQTLVSADKLNTTDVTGSKSGLSCEQGSDASGITVESRKVQTWSERENQVGDSEEKVDSSWFHVPKFALKPHSTGFLQITPEGSPRAKHEGEVGGEADVSGSFCFHTSGHDFTTQQLSEEHQVSCSKEATVTMVTRTTRITQQQVTAETRSDEPLVTSTKTHQLTDEQL